MADRAGRVLFAVDKGELAKLTVAADIRPVLPARSDSRDQRHAPSRCKLAHSIAIARSSQPRASRCWQLRYEWNHANQTLNIVAPGKRGAFTRFAQQALASAKLLIVIRHLALWALLATTVFRHVLKWLASPGMPQAMQVLISCLRHFVAYGLFFLFRQISTAAGLVAVAALRTIFAITRCQIYYRRNDAWLKLVGAIRHRRAGASNAHSPALLYG